MAFNFAVDGGELTTETRVFLTDARARRSFGAYWLVIRPFSGLIRREWLAGIVRRADAHRTNATSVSVHRTPGEGATRTSSASSGGCCHSCPTASPNLRPLWIAISPAPDCDCAQSPTGGATTYKLGQKVRPEPDSPAIVKLTNIYLSAQEYEVLRALPGRELRKTRWRSGYAAGRLVVDEFGDPLTGLVLAELELRPGEASGAAGVAGGRCERARPVLRWPPRRALGRRRRAAPRGRRRHFTRLSVRPCVLDARTTRAEPESVRASVARGVPLASVIERALASSISECSCNTQVRSDRLGTGRGDVLANPHLDEIATVVVDRHARRCWTRCTK